MQIKEFSKVTNINPYTLRYYEKLGLIKSLRDKNNRRFYQSSDVEWVLFIKKLKDTNMSLKKIKEYAILRKDGDETFKQRLKLLEEHKNIVIEMQNKIKLSLEKLEEKIVWYKNKIL